jgi:hypothetical protein
MSLLCPECGTRTVEPRALPGRTLPYRNFPALPIPAELVLPTCTRCGDIRIGAKEAELLDAALERAAQETLASLGRQAIEAIQEVATQRDVEARLGLSPGYLSKVKRGREVPSAALVSALVLLAVRPNRLKELEGVWSTGRLPPRLTTDAVAQWQADVHAGQKAVAS